MSNVKEVVLDPGHYGNYNTYCSGTTYESVVVLKLSRLIREKLNATGKVHVSLTRDDENDISLYNRGKIAADRGAFIFLSEHTNSGSPSAKGTEVFYSVDLPSDEIWADKLSAKVSEALGTTNRGAKTRESTVTKGEDYYGVIDSAQDNGVPHVFIIESAFHSNEEDEAKLRNDEYLNKIADAQCEVLCEMCGVEYQINNEEDDDMSNRLPNYFNAEFYLIANPDVAQAVKEGKMASAEYHYLNFGYVEKRKYCPELPIDYCEGAYLAKNPDVAQAVANGERLNGVDHWLIFGWKEVRSYKQDEKVIDTSKLKAELDKVIDTYVK